MSWPPQSEELKNDNIYIPELLMIFLQNVYYHHNKEESIGPCRLISLGQDIYAVTKVPLPKHILLPFTIKSLTGNTELIKIINRFGHGISYSKTLEIATALALQKMVEAESGVVLPNEVQSLQPTSLVFNNIDRLEETLSGASTSHRVNGITIQRGFIGPMPKVDKVQLPKTKRRSIPTPADEFFTYNPGRRPEAPPINNILQEFNTQEDADHSSANQKNFLWILARLKSATNQIIPSWTGFNIILRGE